MKKIDWNEALSFDHKHKVATLIYDAFENDGGCGHDLGITGMLAILKAWEKIRDPEKVEDLENL